MKSLHLSRLLVLVAAAILGSEMVLALPSPGTHLTVSKTHALDVLENESSSDNFSSNVFDKRSITDVNCMRATGQNWSPAPVDQAQAATDFLRGTTGLCAVQPTSCVRVSCVDYAAVYLCNNNKHELHWSCFKISAYAQALIDQCPTASRGHGGRVVGGQAWDNDNWNVFIRGEDCEQ
ncbi:hypothetical protein ONS95_005383 [Cadophora gregata]|uniref:uncharacterized protein n=1 Tax=Cadophora gregata TaxID=51156 RepID=UPI0026DCFCAC|nr:uncharacterized protein ONS95_005383 [Cadophora gregata]KAK0103357.1 hypothetical protein ONS95_005383 [Cadophora gregata]KAK0107547.1 hypothetical protein ONS96_003354 [Cadophora gregata f. sp. sojae]